MPRVEVTIRVLNDDRSNLAQSTFQIGDTVTRMLTEEVSPLELVQDLGEILSTSIRDQFPIIGDSAAPEDLHVTSRPGLPESFREVIRRRLASFAGQPATPEVRAAIQREIEAFRTEYPDQMVLPPSVEPNALVDLSETDFSRMESRLLALGHRPEVSMGTSVGDPPYAPEDFEGLFQVPEPPEESNPVSRRIRQALRQVVDGEVEAMDSRTRILSQLQQQGAVSRRTLLAHLGLSETSTQEELEETLRHLPQDQDRIRGQNTVNVMLDDDAPFGHQMILGDTNLFSRAPENRSRSQGILESFREIYGGDFHVASIAGVEPSPRIRVPLPPEDRTDIPTRYQRKPVI